MCQTLDTACKGRPEHTYAKDTPSQSPSRMRLPAKASSPCSKVQRRGLKDRRDARIVIYPFRRVRVQSKQPQSKDVNHQVEMC